MQRQLSHQRRQRWRRWTLIILVDHGVVAIRVSGLHQGSRGRVEISGGRRQRNSGRLLGSGSPTRHKIGLHLRRGRHGAALPALTVPRGGRHLQVG